MNAQITAIINQKGGVGKTTSTVNLGVGLAREGKKVLLVDADPQGSLSISMGLQNPDELSDTLSTLMLAEMEYRPIYPDHGIIHHKEGVDLLPGNIELSGVELSLFNTMSRELVLRNVWTKIWRHLRRVSRTTESLRRSSSARKRMGGTNVPPGTGAEKQRNLPALRRFKRKSVK